MVNPRGRDPKAVVVHVPQGKRRRPRQDGRRTGGLLGVQIRLPRDPQREALRPRPQEPQRQRGGPAAGEDLPCTAMDRDQATVWVGRYERAWRTRGTDALAELFTEDAGYSQGPYRQLVRGLPAIAEMWEAERDGSDEVFTMNSEAVSVDGEHRRGTGASALRRAGARVSRPVDHAVRRRRSMPAVRGMAVRSQPLSRGPVLSDRCVRYAEATNRSPLALPLGARHGRHPPRLSVPPAGAAPRRPSRPLVLLV